MGMTKNRLEVSIIAKESPQVQNLSNNGLSSSEYQVERQASGAGI